jgi:hypothetical protein
MWGSSGDAPNSGQAASARVEQHAAPVQRERHFVSFYFSPSDRPTSKIGNTLRKAQHSVGVDSIAYARNCRHDYR